MSYSSTLVSSFSLKRHFSQRLQHRLGARVQSNLIQLCNDLREPPIWPRLLIDRDRDSRVSERLNYPVRCGGAMTVPVITCPTQRRIVPVQRFSQNLAPSDPINAQATQSFSWEGHETPSMRSFCSNISNANCECFSGRPRKLLRRAVGAQRLSAPSWESRPTQLNDSTRPQRASNTGRIKADTDVSDDM